ncbi:anaphase-promoting complex, subunit 5 [Suhomyces tanzawaensis NRRL Y-17324]|uniref:Anaphase-promoting complex subunit 5 n=1 Tax=Suhomyces tanzawaensis NRRL Y-17324 TaxID=984487 RepID=A0A1E4SBX5_9ASCO|nr:anaphase-promoting complex, subunit 5 [Suhomyces tanzawaensis NRRL Y-17324]ODV77014.1 anaphase-promoting complex, subunit 5 [Suhomyces tanzawaensis NRRL Y-17324]
MHDKTKLLLTEDLSPHKIATLFLVNCYLFNTIKDSQVRSTVYVINQLIQNSLLYNEHDELVVVPTLSDLCHTLHSRVIKDNGQEQGRTDSEYLQKMILDILWSISSVEKLDSLITSIGDTMVGPTVVYEHPDSSFKQATSRSVLGIFIYKMITAFRLLKFDEVFLLYEALVEYREPTRESYLLMGGSIAHSTADGQSSGEESEELLFAHLNQQLEDILDSSIAHSSSDNSANPSTTKLIPVPKHDLQILLDKQINLLETYGTPTPKALIDLMTLMTSTDSNTCLIQNINFNNLPSYYYIKYLENLNQSNYNGAFEALHQYFDYTVSNNSKYFYHFALISRASLHQFFGEDEKAIDSIEEAISVARENKDNSTLTYILSWLFNFIKNKPELWKRQRFYNNNDESQLLNFLIQKSQLVSLLLHSMSYNFATLQLLCKGEPVMSGDDKAPSSYFECILKALYISINDHQSSFIKSTELNSSIWSKVGVPILSEVYNEISMESTDRRNDKLSIQTRSNYLSFLRGETEVSLQRLENLKQQVINTDHSLFNSIQIRSLILSIRLNINRGKFQTCNELIRILETNEIKELELKNELLLLSVEVQICLENFSVALRMISDYLASDWSDISIVIKLNLLKCKIFNITGNYTKGFTLIVSQLHRAKKLGFQSLLAEGLIILVSTLNNLDHYEECYEILNEVIPVIISIGHKSLISECYFELSKSCHKLYLHGGKSDMFSQVLRYLNLSIVGFKSAANLVMLTKCFAFEQAVAEEKGDATLQHHAAMAIEKLSARSKQETSYGLVR